MAKLYKEIGKEGKAKRMGDTIMPIESKRRYERADYISDIEFLVISDLDELKKIPGKGISVDIDIGGLGVITDYPLEVGDILFFKDEFEIENFVAKSAIVRWVKNIEENKYRVGLEFFGYR